MPKSKQYTKSIYNGLAINCNEELPIFKGCLDSIYNQSLDAVKHFEQPVGYHVVLREGLQSMSDFMEGWSRSFKLHYEKKVLTTLNEYRFAYTWVREQDSTNDGFHFHVAFIIDNKYSRVDWMWGYLTEQCRKGNLWHFDKTVTPLKDLDVAKGHRIYRMNKSGGIHLKTYMADWIHRCSYLAKVRTKPVGRRTYQSNRPFENVSSEHILH